MNPIIEDLEARDLLGLVDEVCRQRRVTRDELCGRGRTKAVAVARHEVWWRLRHHPDAAFSFQEIGRLFDRDHATVIHGIRAHDRRLRGSGDAAPSAEPERAQPAEADRAR
jgi:chromosomal replication initiation ATPase DnaA